MGAGGWRFWLATDARAVMQPYSLQRVGGDAEEGQVRMVGARQRVNKAGGCVRWDRV